MPDPTPGPAPDLDALVRNLRYWVGSWDRKSAGTLVTKAADALEALRAELGHQIERGDRAEADAARLRIVLRDVEWSEMSELAWSICPCCKRPNPRHWGGGHAADCTVAAALAGEREGGETG